MLLFLRTLDLWTLNCAGDSNIRNNDLHLILKQFRLSLFNFVVMNFKSVSSTPVSVPCCWLVLLNSCWPRSLGCNLLMQKMGPLWIVENLQFFYLYRAGLVGTGLVTMKKKLRVAELNLKNVISQILAGNRVYLKF